MFYPVHSMPFSVPEESGPQPLIVTPPQNQGAVTPGGMTDFFSSVHTLAGAAREVRGTWGEINDLGGQEDPPPQPTEKALRQGPIDDGGGGMGFLGLTTVGILAGAAAAVLVWLAGGNLAWALVSGIAAALLLPFVLG